MAESIQIVAFDGGELRPLGPEIVPGEAVLALPLSRLVVKMVRVSAEGDVLKSASEVLAAVSPFPDEQLTVSCETVRETEEERIVIAAALPEGAADDIADALDAVGINVTKVDILPLGELRGLWPQLSGGAAGARRLVLLGGADCISLFVLDDDQPTAVRAITSGDDLRREVMLSLLEAEDFGGAKPLSEVAVAGDLDASGLESFAPVRRLETAEDRVRSALEGIAARAEEPSSMDALPASWRDVLDETRFKAKLRKFLAVSGGIWAVVMLVLFGVPFLFGLLTDRQKSLCREHSRQYKSVLAMKEKVDLVRKYSDHARGALETMKTVSDLLPLPEGSDSSCIELGSWNFRREDGVKFSGEADSAQLVYQFKDALIECGLFKRVDLQGPSAGKGGRQRFDIDCRFEEEEEQE